MTRVVVIPATTVIRETQETLEIPATQGALVAAAVPGVLETLEILAAVETRGTQEVPVVPAPEIPIRRIQMVWMCGAPSKAEPPIPA